MYVPVIKTWHTMNEVMMNTVDPVPTYFGTGVDVRRAFPAAGGLIELERRKFFRMHTYEKCACKSFGMHCYKIIGLKVPWNEYLQKEAGGGAARLAPGAQPACCPDCPLPRRRALY